MDITRQEPFPPPLYSYGVACESQADNYALYFLNSIRNSAEIPWMVDISDFAAVLLIKGCLELLSRSGISIKGMKAVVVGQRLKLAILSSTKLKIFNNSVQISTLPSSRVYMNLDTDIVAAMWQRLYSDGYVAPERSLSTHTYSSTMATPIKTLSLKELSEKTSTEMLD
ncbi:hypothetical protein ACET3Z_014538 [Daucus carota]